MAPINRVFIPVSTAEYARVWKVSTRVARQRAIKSGVKVGNRWILPVPAAEYASKKGIKPASARKRKGAVRAPDAKTASIIAEKKRFDELYVKALKRMEAIAGKAAKWNKPAVEKRLLTAKPEQLSKIILLRTIDTHTAEDEDLLNDDDEPLSYYH